MIKQESLSVTLLGNETVSLLEQNGHMRIRLSSFPKCKKTSRKLKRYKFIISKRTNWRGTMNMKDSQKLLKNEWRSIDQLKWNEKNPNLKFMGRRLLQRRKQDLPGVNRCDRGQEWGNGENIKTIWRCSSGRVAPLPHILICTPVPRLTATHFL